MNPSSEPLPVPDGAQSSDSLLTLREALRAFAKARDWEPFHSPKNLAMALSAEAAEVIEHFLWVSEADSASLDPTAHEAVALELADVLMYLVRLADVLDVDLAAACERKLLINARRYPVERARGRADKYDRL